MANYTAADVKKLREETDAPMMECKTALDEAAGDFTRAKEILREKGKAAAAKRSDRSTAAGVVAFATGEGKTAGVVLECETDFVALNPEFVVFAGQAAQAALGGATEFSELETEATAKFRERAKISRHVVLEGEILTYIHHDKTKGAAVVVAGEGDREAVRKVAIQAVAFPPEYLDKSEISAEWLESQLAIETKRAMDEGKPESIAKNIAQGRVNKEVVKSVVLLEQPFYADPAKSVAQYLSESAKGAKVTAYAYLAVGQTA